MKLNVESNEFNYHGIITLNEWQMVFPEKSNIDLNIGGRCYCRVH